MVKESCNLIRGAYFVPFLKNQIFARRKAFTESEHSYALLILFGSCLPKTN